LAYAIDKTGRQILYFKYILITARIWNEVQILNGPATVTAEFLPMMEISAIGFELRRRAGALMQSQDTFCARLSGRSICFER